VVGPPLFQNLFNMNLEKIKAFALDNFNTTPQDYPKLQDLDPAQVNFLARNLADLSTIYVNEYLMALETVREIDFKEARNIVKVIVWQAYENWCDDEKTY